MTLFSSYDSVTVFVLMQSMLAVDISETNSRLSLAIADQKITDGEIALNSKASVVRTAQYSTVRALPHHILFLHP